MIIAATSGGKFRLRINDEAPNFTAETSQGTINFHEWIGNGWAILTCGTPQQRKSNRF